MKCSNCGKDLAEGNLFCDGCGAKVVAEQPVQAPVQPVAQPMPQQPYYGYQQPPKKGKGMLVLVIIMAIIILAGVGFGIWYFALRGDDKGGNNTNGNGSGNGNTVVNDNNVNTNTNNTVEPSSQKLVCTQSQTSPVQGYNIKIEQELTVGFITGKINDANLIVVVTIPDDLYELMKTEGDVETQMLYFEEQLKTSFSASFGTAVKNMTASHTGKVVTIKLEIDVTQAGTETFDDTKSYFEAEGYTCR